MPVRMQDVEYLVKTSKVAEGGLFDVTPIIIVYPLDIRGNLPKSLFDIPLAASTILRVRLSFSFSESDGPLPRRIPSHCLTKPLKACSFLIKGDRALASIKVWHLIPKSACQDGRQHPQCSCTRLSTKRRSSQLRTSTSSACVNAATVILVGNF
ncbi:hypothetical protein PHSY_005292 [Pseudozyma hubeiensis SY62]|uniref:Uncharacterized protein n=1 Tax=Pseudozyma hubeiensis (strain SY62) TaxID=1305764 RepID=R9PHX5_PSEHS|nr:hypothetical protein PHSY_005292 [Pseudozyma hubeiensis SY62]GAC97705.1 hypothetical protein PHSY_005292 [Pseudozyma hubeiensis SY62]